MRQLAWLDFHGGYWHLAMDHANGDARKWASRQSALADLKAEGWIPDEADAKRPTSKHEGKKHSYRYTLRRTIH